MKVVLEIAAVAEEVTVGKEGLSTTSGENRLVSPSAIQEVKINQNPYSAEYFRPDRGRIEVVTKQGSPEYHGTFNFILRDSSLNARDFFHTVWAEYALQDRAATTQGAGGFTLPEAAANGAFHEDDLDVSDQMMVTPKIMNHTTSVSPGTRIVVQAAEWSHRIYDDLSGRTGTFFFSSLQDYEQGRPYAFTRQAGNGFVPLFQKIVGGYVQDEVQLGPNLPVALGARYDYQNLLHDGHLAARMFAAFAPRNGRSVVLRAGIGVFNDRFPPFAAADLIRYDGRHLSSYLLLDPICPDPTVGSRLSAASGRPHTLTTGRDDDRDGFATDRPPDVGRNTLRGPGFADLDLQVSRNVHFDRSKGEKGPTATVGVGVFNALNAVSKTTIVGNLSSPFFVAAVPPRRVQLSARFSS